MNIAIIPARGGSKRIPRKNIKIFCGKPIIAWPIIAADYSRLRMRCSRGVQHDPGAAGIRRPCMGIDATHHESWILASASQPRTDRGLHAVLLLPLL